MIDQYVEFKLWLERETGNVSAIAQTGWADVRIKLTAGWFEHDVLTAIVQEASYLVMEADVRVSARPRCAANIVAHITREMLARGLFTVENGDVRFLGG